MPHPRRRTWGLGTLDPSLTYRLWFDPVAFRWEVVAVGTRAEHDEDLAVAARGGALAARASGAARGGGAPDGDDGASAGAAA